MKKFFYSMCFAGFPICSFGLPNLYCSFSGVDFPYSVQFFPKSETALVFDKTHEVAEFGKLSCSKIDDSYNSEWYTWLYSCHSEDVNDAGFAVYLIDSLTNGFTLSLYEVTFAGSKLLADFPCWNQNLVHRT